MVKPRTPTRRQAQPLPARERIDIYRAQTGRPTLTPKQRRRVDHKQRVGSGRRQQALRDALKG